MKYSTMFKDKKILLTGGTGSIGSEVLKNLLSFSPKLVRVYSRDEYKQHKLKHRYDQKEPIQYVIGDVRDKDAVYEASKGIDIIFHCAALKHVPISEEMPEEFIKTNIFGSINIKKAATEHNIPLVVSISTDKAVSSLNVMGLTKAIQEKIFGSSYYQFGMKTRFVNVRFGNVIGTHGSLFPIIYHQIKNKLPITITHPEMTRFYMSKQEAADLIFWAAMNGNNGETIVKKMKSIIIKDLVPIFISKLNLGSTYPQKNIGVRVGEKMHEELINEDEIYRIKEDSTYYTIQPYKVGELQDNILDSPQNQMHDLHSFSSQNPNNYLTEQEICKYIDDFIEDIESQNTYL